MAFSLLERGDADGLHDDTTAPLQPVPTAPSDARRRGLMRNSLAGASAPSPVTEVDAVGDVSVGDVGVEGMGAGESGVGGGVGGGLVATAPSTARGNVMDARLRNMKRQRNKLVQYSGQQPSVPHSGNVSHRGSDIDEHDDDFGMARRDVHDSFDDSDGGGDGDDDVAGMGHMTMQAPHSQDGSRSVGDGYDGGDVRRGGGSNQGSVAVGGSAMPQLSAQAMGAVTAMPAHMMAAPQHTYHHAGGYVMYRPHGYDALQSPGAVVPVSGLLQGVHIGGMPGAVYAVPQQASVAVSPAAQWSCSRCAYRNDLGDEVCRMCASHRSSALPSPR